VRRVLKTTNTTTTKDLIAELVKLHPAILAAAPYPILANQTQFETPPKVITDKHRLPRWDEMFAIFPGTPPKADFLAPYRTALVEMIVESDDESAAKCIHGIGYAYLNGALANGGFLDRGDPSTTPQTEPKRVWVAGDYGGVRPRNLNHYPSVRISTTAPDDAAALNGTTIQLARLYALIKTGALVTSASSGDDDTASRDMGILLQPSAKRLHSWLTLALPLGTRGARILIQPAKVFYDKIGFARFTIADSGPNVYAETSLLLGPVAAENNYIVSWQHMTKVKMFNFLVPAILAAIAEYEQP
jgi:hypothetical protein